MNLMKSIRGHGCESNPSNCLIYFANFINRSWGPEPEPFLSNQYKFSTWSMYFMNLSTRIWGHEFESN